MGSPRAAGARPVWQPGLVAVRAPRGVLGLSCEADPHPHPIPAHGAVMETVRATDPHDATDLPLNAPDVTVLALFLVFAEISLSSFGGAIAWARIVLVERRGWLGERQFAELLGLCQSVPGPSLVNMAIYLGTRHHGVPGAVAAASGFLLPPLVILLPLGILYEQGAQLEIVRLALHGVAAAAAGMLLATGLKMVQPYWR